MRFGHVIVQLDQPGCRRDKTRHQTVRNRKSMSKTKDWLAVAGTDTKLCHIGYDPSDYHGFVNPPVVHASTVLFPNARAMETRSQPYTYGTRGTPTTDALCSAIDALEGSAGTILVPSGLAAITVPFLAFLSAGDHALIVDSVYSPCRHFCDTMLTRLGVEVEYYDPEIGADIERLIRPNTKLVHTEAPGSNTMEMQDIRAISDAPTSMGVWSRSIIHGQPRSISGRLILAPTSRSMPRRSILRATPTFSWAPCRPMQNTGRR